ncbi:MAG TPA: hypothetical protein VM756_17335 [Burkholderiales bacterium]|jgi:hypothetical protein|nr:hypothetical protein [Burkholderiales bacterium]
MYSPQAQMINQIVALGLVMIFIGLLRINIGVAPTIIVGGSAAVGFFCWRATNLRQPIHPLKTTIVFLLTTAALHVHMYEEHDCLFGPAMSRLFEIAFPDARFLQIFVFILPAIYYLTAIGLLLRIPLAGFIAWFIFIGPGIAEFTHFIFPLIPPALEPHNPAAISAVVNGVRIVGMENHHVAVTGTYYFPGLYTAIIPMIPGIYAVYWLFRSRSTASP